MEILYFPVSERNGIDYFIEYFIDFLRNEYYGMIHENFVMIIQLKPGYSTNENSLLTSYSMSIINRQVNKIEPT